MCTHIHVCKNEKSHTHTHTHTHAHTHTHTRTHTMKVSGCNHTESLFPVAFSQDTQAGSHGNITPYGETPSQASATPTHTNSVHYWQIESCIEKKKKRRRRKKDERGGNLLEMWRHILLLVAVVARYVQSEVES